MLGHRFTIPLLTILLLSRWAFAGTSEEPERAAQAACQAGDHGKGVAILSELFAATHKPAFIYGQGLCLEQNQRHKDAIAKFQEYLRQGKKLTKSDRAAAQERITACQARLAQEMAPESGAVRSNSKEAKERTAKKACLNRETDKGVKLLTDLYVDTNDPTYIFNQGRCYEQGSQYREAIERFREYLRKTKTATDAERADVNRHIADCKALLDAQKQDEPVKVEVIPPAAESPPSPEPPKEPPVAQAPALVETMPLAPSERAGAGLRIAGIVTASVGVAAMATSIALNLKHNNIIREMRTNYDDDTYASAGGYKTGAIIGYAAGAACIAGGAVLYFFGLNGRDTTVTPVAGAERAGLMVTGRFP
jgi:tetratricopeptide (TPR) repeat protein